MEQTKLTSAVKWRASAIVLAVCLVLFKRVDAQMLKPLSQEA